MSQWWDDFCKEENKRRIEEMKSEIKRLEKELEGKEIQKDIKIGEYPLTIVPCGE